MQTLTRSLLAGGVAVAALTVGISQAQAEFSLSERYTDSDGDLVADIPADESQWLDPDTLVFAYTPVEDPAVYAGVWDGFLEHMEEVTGKTVPVRYGDRRPGDPAHLVADPGKAREILGWEAQFKGARPMIESAWRWMSQPHQGHFSG